MPIRSRRQRDEPTPELTRKHELVLQLLVDIMPEDGPLRSIGKLGIRMIKDASEEDIDNIIKGIQEAARHVSDEVNAPTE